MPLKRTTKNGISGFKWSDSGKVYTFTPGNAASRAAAKNRALKQGRAIEANKRKP